MPLCHSNRLWPFATTGQEAVSSPESFSSWLNCNAARVAHAHNLHAKVARQKCHSDNVLGVSGTDFVFEGRACIQKSDIKAPFSED